MRGPGAFWTALECKPYGWGQCWLLGQGTGPSGLQKRRSRGSFYFDALHEARGPLSHALQLHLTKIVLPGACCKETDFIPVYMQIYIHVLAVEQVAVQPEQQHG